MQCRKAAQFGAGSADMVRATAREQYAANRAGCRLAGIVHENFLYHRNPCPFHITIRELREEILPFLPFCFETDIAKYDVVCSNAIESARTFEGINLAPCRIAL